jgi:hypothetical protein
MSPNQIIVNPKMLLNTFKPLDLILRRDYANTWLDDKGRKGQKPDAKASGKAKSLPCTEGQKQEHVC